jgi:hypothetical protein
MRNVVQGGMGCSTHSKPASPVNVASLFGFSNRHSRDCCRHRLQGGLSAPSHRIFCFLQAFYRRHYIIGIAKSVRLTQAPRERESEVGQRRGQWVCIEDERGTLFSVVLTGLLSFGGGGPPPSRSSCFLISEGPGRAVPLTIFMKSRDGCYGVRDGMAHQSAVKGRLRVATGAQATRSVSDLVTPSSGRPSPSSVRLIPS